MTPNSLVHETPKDFRFDNSVSESNTPAVLSAEMPSPYNMYGDEKKRRSKSGTSMPNPHRKFSKQWFNYAYETARQVGKWPRIAYVLVGIILVGVWIAVM